MARLLAGERTPEGKPGLQGSKKTAPQWAKKCIGKSCIGMILETAHPAKFGETVNKAISREPTIPDRLAKVLNLPDRSEPMSADYDDFKDWLEKTL